MDSPERKAFHSESTKNEQAKFISLKKSVYFFLHLSTQEINSNAVISQPLKIAPKDTQQRTKLCPKRSFVLVICFDTCYVH